MSNMNDVNRNDVNRNDEDMAVELKRHEAEKVALEEKIDEYERLSKEFKELLNKENGGYTLENNSPNHINVIHVDADGQKINVFEYKNGDAKFSHPVDQNCLNAYFKTKANDNPKGEMVVNSCGSLEDAMKLAQASKDNNVPLVFKPEVLEKLKNISPGGPETVDNIEKMLSGQDSGKRFKM